MTVLDSQIGKIKEYQMPIVEKLVTWVVWQGSDLIESLRSLGRKVIVVTGDNSFDEALKASEAGPVALHGSLSMCYRADKTRLEQGLFFDWEKFKCSYYYPKIPKHLLINGYCQYMPAADFVAANGVIPGRPLRGTELNMEPIFVRGDSPLKDVASLVVRPGVSTDIYDFKNITPEKMLVISLCKRINAEYRFWVSNGKVVCGSQYMSFGEISYSNEFPQQALQMAERIAKIQFGFKEDFYVVDVADTAQGFYVVELNCASSSGVYHTDHASLIEEFEVRAIEKWIDYYGEE